MDGSGAPAGSAVPDGRVSPAAPRQGRSTKAAWKRSGATMASAAARATPRHRSARPGPGAVIRVKARLACQPVGQASAHSRHGALPSTETSPSAPSRSENAAISNRASRGRCAWPGTIKGGRRSSNRDAWSPASPRAPVQQGSSAMTVNAPHPAGSTMPRAVREARSAPPPCRRGTWRAAGRSDRHACPQQSLGPRPQGSGALEGSGPSALVFMLKGGHPPGQHPWSRWCGGRPAAAPGCAANEPNGHRGADLDRPALWVRDDGERPGPAVRIKGGAPPANLRPASLRAHAGRADGGRQESDLSYVMEPRTCCSQSTAPCGLMRLKY